MRILMVTPSYYPIIGGTETYVQQLSLKLNEGDAKVDIMTFSMNSKWNPVKRDETINKNGLIIYRVAALNPRSLNFRGDSAYSRFLNIHVIPRLTYPRDFKRYDIIHFHDDVDLSFPAFSRLFLREKKPRLMHCHSLDGTHTYYKRNFVPRTIFRRVAHLYIGLSSYSKKLLLDLGIPDSKLAVLPNAVDTEVFQPKYEEKINNLILHVGRLTPSKGLHVLLQSLFQVDNPVKLVIIGPSNDQRYCEKINNLIQKLGDETKHEVIHLGLVDEKTLITWYQRASLFVCPSFSEPFGLVNLEALACGTPVIGTKIGGIPDIVKTGKNGTLVPPGAPLALAAAVEELLVDEKKRKSYGILGREIVERNFSWEVVVPKLTKLYNLLLAEK